MDTTVTGSGAFLCFYSCALILLAEEQIRGISLTDWLGHRFYMCGWPKSFTQRQTHFREDSLMAPSPGVSAAFRFSYTNDLVLQT